MATNQQGSLARYNTPQQTDYLRRRITFQNTQRVLVGILPPRAIINKASSFVDIVTVFNAGTTNTVDIGIEGTAGRYGSAIALGTANQVALNGTGTFQVAGVDDVYIWATVNMSGTAATTGEAHVVINFTPANDAT
jgi:hypothetical protein